MQYAYLTKSLSLFPELGIGDVGLVTDKHQNDFSFLVRFFRLSNSYDIPADALSFFDISQTGDSFDYKVCDRCFKRLETKQDFSNNRHKKDNYITKRPSCKACRKIKDGVNVSRKDREYWEAKKPKPYTPFTCPICSKLTIAGISKIVLDHNHKNGKVRGYLCESCNTGIGRFDDDPILVYKALEWLNNQ